jgi:hypothetical protein
MPSLLAHWCILYIVKARTFSDANLGASLSHADVFAWWMRVADLCPFSLLRSNGDNRQFEPSLLLPTASIMKSFLSWPCKIQPARSWANVFQSEWSGSVYNSQWAKVLLGLTTIHLHRAQKFETAGLYAPRWFKCLLMASIYGGRGPVLHRLLYIFALPLHRPSAYRPLHIHKCIWPAEQVGPRPYKAIS